MNAKEKLEVIISHAKADVNLCAAALSLIMDAPIEEQVNLAESFFKGFKTVPTKADFELSQIISKDEEKKLMLRYGPIVDAYLEELLEQSLPNKAFYSELWDYITTSEALPTTQARIIALFDCAIDKRIPYVHIDRAKALKMNQATFQECNNKIGDEKFQTLEYILNSKWEQKTEEASLVVKMLDDLEDFNLRTVFMTRIIAHFQVELNRLHLRDMFSMLSDDV